MFRVVQIREAAGAGWRQATGRFGDQARPGSWALGAFLLVLFVPLLLLLLLAAVVAMAVFAVAALVGAALAWVRRVLGISPDAGPRDDGRRNVRVIMPRDED